MNRKSMVLVGVAVAFLFGTAESCNVEPTAPNTGKVTMVTPNSAACVDKAPNTTGVMYVPAGTDPNGAPWPSKVACVNPGGKQYAAGSTYP